jgi:hypothetical protein
MDKTVIPRHNTVARPSLSIALASYNGERYIGEQLDSIVKQTRLPDELVISDDASVDATPAIIEDFARQAPFPVRLLRNSERLGSTRNFETAINACSGDVIFLCDQDDVWYPAKIALVEERFINNPGMGALFTDGDVVDENLRPICRMWDIFEFKPKEQRIVEAGDPLAVLFRHSVVTGATMAFRSGYRQLVLPVPNLPNTWHDEWIALLISATSSLGTLPTPLIAYRQHSSNQVGIVGMPSHGKNRVRNRGQNRRRTHAEIYGARAIRFEAARARLLEHSELFPVDPRKMHSFNDVLRFLQACVGLPPSRWRRLPTAVHELMAMRYHRYEKGLKSFRKDLLR